MGAMCEVFYEQQLSTSMYSRLLLDSFFRQQRVTLHLGQRVNDDQYKAERDTDSKSTEIRSSNSRMRRIDYSPRCSHNPNRRRERGEARHDAENDTTCRTR